MSRPVTKGVGTVLTLAMMAGCFESGPLGSASTAPDTVSAPELPLADGRIDISVTETTVADPGPSEDAQTCLTNDDCSGLSDDACQGVFVCVEGACQRDPSTVVSCPDDGDDCTIESCDPSTGSCRSEPSSDASCACQPVAVLPCGGAQTISTADFGETNVLNNYPCGPDGGENGEHVWLFTSETTQIVSVGTLSLETGGVWVLGYDGTKCVVDACIAGGEKGAAFEAQAGFDYAIVFEHPPGLPVQVTTRVTCGVEDEFSCDNGVDDDLNALTDCSDPACSDSPACQGVPESDCDDGVDNDNDSLTDCADGDCSEVAVCDQSCGGQVFVACGNTYGVNSSTGTSNATDYSCGPAAAGKETGWRLGTAVSGNVSVILSSAVPLRLYVVEDNGDGCSPFLCETWGETQVDFFKPQNTNWYLVVDGDEGVEGAYSFDISCN